MANPKHVKVVRQGAAAIAQWRRRNPREHLDLGLINLMNAELAGANLADAYLLGAHLVGVDLARANLNGANIREANLREANLREANLREANLREANLREANLRETNFIESDLRHADLTGADLSSARFFSTQLLETDFTRANLAGAYLGSTWLGRCDLSRATGLSTVRHYGPSTIGVDTLIASFRGAGNRLTPDVETFFLSAGVPKGLLSALPQIVGEVEYYTCFICYGQPDLDFATKLRDDLAANGVSCWLYDLDKTPGERTWKEIGEVRRQADKMVVVCSAAALIRDGVLKEIEEQIDEEPDKIVPISRDNVWMQTGFGVMRATRDLGPFLRDRNYADFSDESRYDKELQRLLKALRRKGE